MSVSDQEPDLPTESEGPDAEAEPEPEPEAGDTASAGAPPVEEEAEAEPGPDPELSIESLVGDLERVTAERDQYLDLSRRLQAEMENFRKNMTKREADSRQRANESLITALLPVLDACDGAVSSGADDVDPVRSALLEVLGKEGLARIDKAETPFDPAQHDAVMHEPADNEDGQTVAEVMRPGYSWKGRVVRPAMVRVRG